MSTLETCPDPDQRLAGFLRKLAYQNLHCFSFKPISMTNNRIMKLDVFRSNTPGFNKL